MEVTLEQLVAETGWLRRLAHSLVKDDAAADDLVQDAYEVAATRMPRDGRPLRPWLARVMVNLARMRGRGAVRRQARELAAGEPAPIARPDELAARLETQRSLAGLVLELAAPLRDVLLLHYVDGLSSREVGDRLGIAAGTVRWRLKQAHDELRGKLEAREPRRAWVGALAALARGDGIAVGKLALALIAALLAIGVFVLQLALRDDPAPASAPVADEPAAPSALHGAPGQAPVLTPVSSPPRALTGDLAIEGQVVDGSGAAVAGAQVQLGVACKYELAQPAPRRTGIDGRFAFAAPPGCQYWISAVHGGGSARQRFETDPLAPITLALVDQSRTLRVVAAETGAPIAGAAVVAEYVARTDPPVITDAAGEAEVAAGAHELIVRAEGRVAAVVDLGTSWLRSEPIARTVKLARGIPIAGRVVDQHGAPVAGANIGIAKAIADDPDGRAQYMVWEISDAAGEYRAWVPEPGHHMMGVERDHYRIAGEREVDIDPIGPTRADVVVERSADPEPVIVTVLDEHGAPAAGAWVAGVRDSFRPGFTDEAGRYAVRDGDSLYARRGALTTEAVLVRDVRAVTLRLQPAGITGAVVDEHGDPARDVIVTLRAVVTEGDAYWFGGMDQRPGGSGQFSFDVPAGEYMISVRHAVDDEEATPQRVRAGVRDLRLVVTAL